MTPSQFKARYENLKVVRSNGNVETIRVHRYRLNGSSTYNAAAHQTWVNRYIARRIDRDLTLTTVKGDVLVSKELSEKEAAYIKRTGVAVKISMEREGGVATLTKSAVTDWAGMGAYCFLGKGAPEHCQMVLQMAEHWGLAANGIQRYADDTIGLDCNGFVGNYIWFGRDSTPWNEPKYHAAQGPDTNISSFFPQNPTLFVRRWDDLDPSQMYIFGEINGANQIIPGGGGTTGHIVITEPGLQRPASGGSSMAMWVVESAGGRGLVEGWCTCVANDPNTRTFTVRRAHGGFLRCKIAAL
jgi:hypothetical protein